MNIRYYASIRGFVWLYSHRTVSVQKFILFISKTLGCFLFSSFAYATEPGVTPGEFSVDQSGGSNYSIPIVVPPGTAGMQPSLSLNYNSRGGNNLLGVGWSLGGLSVITRCSATTVQDGFIDGVDFDEKDRFCFDGQRLIAVVGIDGEDGTEYRTEIDTFTKVISYDTDNSNNGPEQFRVWTKSGQVMEYGFTNDARIEAQGKSDVRVWAVNKIQDTVGNYLTVSYVENNSIGEYYPDRIDYTGNVSQGLNPYNSVRFIYESRSDITPLYFAGSVVKNTKRLAHIHTYADTTLVRDYRLTHDNNGVVGRTRLKSIQECDDAGACFPGNSFQWQNSGNNTYSAFITSSSSDSSTKYPSAGRWIDINSDGLADWVWTGSHSLKVRFSNGNGTFGPFHVSSHNDGSDKYPAAGSWADVNGDGYIDWVWTGSWALKVRLSNGDGTFGPLVVSPSSDSSTKYPSSGRWVDINADGLADWVWTGSHSLKVRFSNGNGTFGPFTVSSHNDGSDKYPAAGSWADVNGDGLTDWVWTGSWALKVRLSNGNGTFGPLVISPSSDSSTKYPSAGSWADVNGDGMIDWVWTGSHSLKVRFSNGDGTFGPFTVSSHNDGSDKYPAAGSWADVNSDGFTDWVWTGSWALKVRLSNGNGTFGPLVISPSSDSSTKYPSAGSWADVNGDGLTDWVWTGSSTLKVRLSNNILPDMLIGMTDGLGVDTDITYKPLTNNSVYTKFNDAMFPQQDMQSPMHVVSSIKTENGVGGQSETTYQYAGAKVDVSGRGFLGFATMQSTDEQTGIKTLTTYRQDYPFNGLIDKTETRLNDGTLIGQTQTVYGLLTTHNGVSFPYADQTIKNSYELDGSLITIVTTENTYDNHGNPTNITITTENHDRSESFITDTHHDYTNDTANWFLGRLTRTEVTQILPDNTSATRVSAFSYNLNGLLSQEIIEPDISAFRLVTDHDYDSFGNEIETTVSGNTITTRSTENVFDDRGQFVVQVINALGQSETRIWNTHHGNMLSLTGPNGLTTRWNYDDFGRKTEEIRADDTSSSIIRQWCDGFNGEIGYLDCPTDGALVLMTQSAGSPTTKAYSDKYGREIRVETEGFDGPAIYIDTIYNSLGQVEKKSRPYFSGETPLWHEVTYDILGRTIRETSPDGSYTLNYFEGLATTTDNDLGQLNTRFKNVRGDLIQVMDSQGKTTHYQHDPFGHLINLIDSQGNLTQNAFDIRGRKIAMNDPDMGIWDYQYNELGELVSQTDAKEQTQVMTYDLLGRMISRTEAEGVSNWVYDTATHGIGKLASVSGAEGKSESFTYDALGRALSTTTTIDGQSYSQSQSYDSLSRVDVMTYPASAQYPSGFQVKQIYNARGYLSQVVDVDTQAVYWQAQAHNAEGQLTAAIYGNGVETSWFFDANTGLINGIRSSTPMEYIQDDSYSFDTIGNLTQRQNVVTGVSETFVYDNLNRLIQSNLNDNTQIITKDYGYDAIGNVTFKTGTGSYSYLNAGPHAVTNVDGYDIVYDANGNMVSGWNFTKGQARALQWTSYNKLYRVTQGSSDLTFYYGADRARFKQINGNGKTTIYVGGGYEKEVTSTEITHVYYIRAGGGAIAIHKSREDVSGVFVSGETRYLHKDHIGSIAGISDEVGNIVEQLSYDPHGKRRQAIDWNDASQQITALTTMRSFTGHEYLEDVGLIHMNGRVYDPDMGRFLSADPIVQAPTNPQNLNRYSYVLNNPLSATDPSGFLFGFIKKALKGIAVKVFKRILRNPIVQAVVTVIATIHCGPPCAAAASATFTAINGGSIGDIVKSSAIAYATAYAFNQVGGINTDGFAQYAVKTVAAGVVGGVSSRLQGGRFMDGFAAAGAAQFLGGSKFIKMLGDIGQGIARTVIGGTSSVLGGGKFKNGAVTAAFTYVSVRIIDIGEKLNIYRQEGSVYVTGHRVGKVGPTHLALEYNDINGKPVTISASPKNGFLVSELNRSTDAPTNNVTIGTVNPPNGLTNQEYFHLIMSADVNYCDCADYDFFPNISNGYNSNSYVGGLIKSTGGSVSSNLNGFIGGGFPLPSFHFEN